MSFERHILDVHTLKISCERDEGIWEYREFLIGGVGGEHAKNTIKPGDKGNNWIEDTHVKRLQKYREAGIDSSALPRVLAKISKQAGSTEHT